MTAENDIVLVYHEDEPLVFARVEDIRPDVKKNWYQVKLLLLQLPVQTVTWILKDVYVNGAEFTMGGRRMRLEKIEPPAGDQDEPAGAPGGSQPASPGSGSGRVISLKDRKPK